MQPGSLNITNPVAWLLSNTKTVYIGNQQIWWLATRNTQNEPLEYANKYHRLYRLQVEKKTG